MCPKTSIHVSNARSVLYTNVRDYCTQLTDFSSLCAHGLCDDTELGVTDLLSNLYRIRAAIFKSYTGTQRKHVLLRRLQSSSCLPVEGITEAWGRGRKLTP